MCITVPQAIGCDASYVTGTSYDAVEHTTQCQVLVPCTHTQPNPLGIPIPNADTVWTSNAPDSGEFGTEYGDRMMLPMGLLYSSLLTMVTYQESGIPFHASTKPAAVS